MSKWLTIGKVLKKKSPKTGLTVAFGDKYRKINVKLVVTDANGHVLAEVENPFLNVSDPRKRPGITEEQADKIPDFLLQELSLVTD